MMRLADEENEASRRFSSGVLGFVGGMVTIAALRLEAVSKRRLGDRLDAVFDPLRRSIKLNEAKWCFVDLVTTALTCGVVALYVWQSERGGAGVLIGAVFVIYKYAEQAGAVVGQAATHFQSFARFKVNFASADEIWDAPTKRDLGAALDGDWRTIELHRLCFAHDDESGIDRPKGVHDVRLTLRRGERIALVGPSGSGKSTLMRVMAGLYPATSGHLVVDGVAHLGARPLASIATFVPQDADVFEATVLENLAPAGIDDERAFDDALFVSGFGTVLPTLPQGVATPVAERGVNLSGGQRQRLGLARGLLAAHGRSLLLLDEPTSALDPLTEAHVLRGLAERFPDTTVVASIHRMGALVHFDRVVLMVDGEVIDSGTSDELAVRQPLFAAMLGGVDGEVGRQAA